MVDVGQRGVDTVRAVWGKWVACLGIAASAVGRDVASTVASRTISLIREWMRSGWWKRIGSSFPEHSVMLWQTSMAMLKERSKVLSVDCRNIPLYSAHVSSSRMTIQNTL